MNSPYTFGVSRSSNFGRPFIVFLHGFLGSKSEWDAIRPAFEDSFSAVALDLPGHGDTIAGDDSLFRIQNCAAGIVQWLDANQVHPCHLVGYSMGGRLAVFLAINYPDRFASYVLESTSPGLKTAAERAERLTHDQALAHKLETLGLDRFLDDWYGRPMFASLRENQSRFSYILEQRRRNDVAGLGRSLRYMGSGAQPSLWERLLEIRSPLLYIAGEWDDKFRSIGAEVTRLCPEGKMCIIPHCGHNVHLERPAQFIKAVRSFMLEQK